MAAPAGYLDTKATERSAGAEVALPEGLGAPTREGQQPRYRRQLIELGLASGTVLEVPGELCTLRSVQPAEQVDGGVDTARALREHVDPPNLDRRSGPVVPRDELASRRLLGRATTLHLLSLYGDSR
ncbi:MAG: hypothetical protein ACT4O0_13245 [Pseudonocardia sp.]